MKSPKPQLKMDKRMTGSSTIDDVLHEVRHHKQTIIFTQSRPRSRPLNRLVSSMQVVIQLVRSVIFPLHC
jgi:hypothetical protein